LLPDDKRQVELDLSAADIKGNQDGLKLVVEGWNIIPEEIKF
jgi:hypothetical protein